MALKAQTNDSFDYLNKLCEDNGIEIVIPDMNNEEKKEDEKEEESE